MWVICASFGSIVNWISSDTALIARFNAQTDIEKKNRKLLDYDNWDSFFLVNSMSTWKSLHSINRSIHYLKQM